jgi:hypothetical protein
MNAKDVAEGNSIEREPWAIRARIRYHKSIEAKEERKTLRSAGAASS